MHANKLSIIYYRKMAVKLSRSSNDSNMKPLLGIFCDTCLSIPKKCPCLFPPKIKYIFLQCLVSFQKSFLEIFCYTYMILKKNSFKILAMLVGTLLKKLSSESFCYNFLSSPKNISLTVLIFADSFC